MDNRDSAIFANCLRRDYMGLSGNVGKFPRRLRLRAGREREMSLDTLEKDTQGNIVTRPVIGWITAPVADMFVLLGLKYAETPDQIKSGGKRIQFGLLPAQALELAEMLTKQAQAILDQQPSEPPN
jgi:hypothetical protein